MPGWSKSSSRNFANSQETNEVRAGSESSASMNSIRKCASIQIQTCDALAPLLAPPHPAGAGALLWAFAGRLLQLRHLRASPLQAQRGFMTITPLVFKILAKALVSLEMEMASANIVSGAGFQKAMASPSLT